jgi:hypothetical protein
MISAPRSIMGFCMLAWTCAPAWGQAESGRSVPLVERQHRTSMVKPGPGVTRLCYLHASGTLYCREVVDLLQKEWAGADAAVLQSNLASLYEANGLDSRLNGLVSCHGEALAAAQQSAGSRLTGADVHQAHEACLAAMKDLMATGRPGNDAVSNLGRSPGTTTGRVGGGRGGEGGSGSACFTADPTKMGGGQSLWDRFTNYWGFGGGKETVESIAYTVLSAFMDRGTGALAPLASESGAEFQMGVFQALKRKYEIEFLAETGDTETYSKIRGMQPAEFLEFVKERHPEEEKRAKEGDDQRVAPDSDGLSCSEIDLAIQQLIERCEASAEAHLDYDCAKLYSCPDPTIALYGPDQVVICGHGTVTIFDGERLLREALIRECESKVRYGPGESPCRPPAMGEAGGAADWVRNICNDPLAVVTEECYSSRAAMRGAGEPDLLFPLRSHLDQKLATAQALLCKAVGTEMCARTAGLLHPSGGAAPPIPGNGPRPATRTEPGLLRSPQPSGQQPSPTSPGDPPRP